MMKIYFGLNLFDVIYTTIFITDVMTLRRNHPLQIEAELVILQHWNRPKTNCFSH